VGKRPLFIAAVKFILRFLHDGMLPQLARSGLQEILPEASRLPGALRGFSQRPAFHYVLRIVQGITGPGGIAIFM
jgi:hypothetical protein